MIQALKITGWIVLALAGIIAAFLIWPELSERTQWGVAIFVVGITVTRPLIKMEREAAEFRFRVESDLRQIKRRMGIEHD